jgi:DNA repair exonuclease SbcCD ATPase subunit
MFVSCNNAKKNATEYTTDKIEIIEVEKDNLDVDEVELETEMRTRTYKIKEQTPIVYNLDENGIAGFDDWADYTVINYELTDIRRTKYVTTAKRIRNMNYRVANLGNTIPSWLKTEEVMEDVADVQKEYLELIKESNAPEKEVKENLEELSEKFDDLKEELDETVAEYVSIHEDAIEEFNEEIKTGNIKAAIEEYNEEINKLDKIVDQKK